MKTEKRDFYFILGYLAFFVLFFFFSRKVILSSWSLAGAPTMPAAAFWGNIPKRIDWSRFFSLWIPFIYLAYPLAYSFLYFSRYSRRTGFVKFSFDRDNDGGKEENKIWKKTIKRDFLTVLAFPLFLFFIFYANAWGDSHLVFVSFYLFLLFCKALVMLSWLRLLSKTAPEDFRGKNLRAKKTFLGLLAVPLLVYFFLAGLRNVNISATGDEPYYLLISESLSADGDWDLKNNLAGKDYRDYYWPGDLYAGQNILETADGRIYSTAYNGLYPLLLAFPHAVRGRLGVMAFNGFLTALLALNIYLLALEVTSSRGVSFLLWGITALSPPLILFANQIYPEILAGLIVCFVYRKIRAADISLGTRLLVFFLLIALPFVKIRFLPISLAFFFAGFFKKERIKRLLPASVVFAFLLLAFAALDHIFFNGTLALARYGNPEWLAKIFYPRTNPLNGFFGFFFDQQFGLVFYSPVFLLFWAAWPLLDKGNRRDFVLSGFIVFSYLFFVLNNFSRFWYGGWSLPSRYLVCLVPLFSVFLGECLVRMDGKYPALKRLTVLWVAVTVFLLNLNPVWQYNRPDGINNFFRFLGERFNLDFARFFPSYANYSPDRWLWAFFLLLTALGWGFYLRRDNAETPRKGFLSFGISGSAATGFLGVVLFFFLLANYAPTGILQGEGMRKTTGMMYEGYPNKNVWVMKEEGKLYDYFIASGGELRFDLYVGGKTNGLDFPRLKVMLNDRVLSEIEVSAKKEWVENVYSLQAAVTRGKNLLTLDFTNGVAAEKDGVFRHIYVDKILINRVGRRKKTAEF